MEKLTINIKLDVRTDGSHDDAIRDIVKMLDLKSLENEECNLTTVESVSVEGEDLLHI
jgi:hypothetical protein